MLIEQIIEFEWRGPRPLAIGVARRLGDPAPIEMLSMTKQWQKAYCFFTFSFFHHFSQTTLSFSIYE